MGWNPVIMVVAQLGISRERGACHDAVLDANPVRARSWDGGQPVDLLRVRGVEELLPELAGREMGTQDLSQLREAQDSVVVIWPVVEMRSAIRDKCLEAHERAGTHVQDGLIADVSTLRDEPRYRIQ